MSKYIIYYDAELNDLAGVIYDRNKRLGFYEKDKVRDFDGMIANIHGEVSEALEEWRKGKEFDETYWTIVGDHFVQRGDLWESPEGEPMLKLIEGRLYVHNYEYDYASTDDRVHGNVQEWIEMTPDLLRQMPNMIPYLKPEGIPSELADIIIRTLDACAYHEIDVAGAIADKMAYNETRPYRHGNKRS